jgi:hypothetical protein
VANSKEGKGLPAAILFDGLTETGMRKSRRVNLMDPRSTSVIWIEMVTVIFQMKKRHRDRLRVVNEGQGECRENGIYVKNRI